MKYWNKNVKSFLKLIISNQINQYLYFVMKLSCITGGCGPSKSDIIFVTDESGSVGAYNFQLTLEALRDTVARLDVDSGNVRVGVMCFQSSQRTIFNLDAYSTVSSMQNAIMDIDYRSGGTKIGSAMKYTRENMFRANQGIEISSLYLL